MTELLSLYMYQYTLIQVIEATASCAMNCEHFTVNNKKNDFHIRQDLQGKCTCSF